MAPSTDSLPRHLAQCSYTVPVVNESSSNDGLTGKALFQAMDNLHQLEDITEFIFDQITQRVQKERTKINEMGQRIEQSKIKVNKLKGRSKAATVFSANKYPSSQIEDFSSIFDSSTAHGSNARRRRGRKRMPKDLDATAMEQQPDDSLTDPIENFFGEWRLRNEREMKSYAADERQGLGKLPDDLGSVSSLLLFNTDKNLYNEYNNIDPLVGEQETNAENDEDEEERDDIAAAPATITGDIDLPTLDQERDEIEFRPQMTEVPALEGLPTTLDLPNVAELPWDTSFGDNSIAPSALPVSDLPDVGSTQDDQTPNPNNNTSNSSSGPNPSGAAPPSPPPPPPPPSTSSPASETSAAPPPPPPPPPDSSSSPTPPPPPPPPEPTPNNDKNASGGGSAGRGDLLSAIRDPGNKTRLRSTQDPSNKPKKKEPRSSSGGGEGGDSDAGPGGLMSMLKKTLNRRYQSMHGKHEVEKPKENASEEIGMPSMLEGAQAYAEENQEEDGSDDDWDD